MDYLILQLNPYGIWDFKAKEAIFIFIAFPSLKLLYLMDEVIDPALTIKAIGHQWYRSYEYSNYGADKTEFDSYMVPTSDLNPGDLRLLEVDSWLIVPIQTQVRVLVTAVDVLHSCGTFLIC